MFVTDRQIIERILIPSMMRAVLVGVQQTLGWDAGRMLLEPITALLDVAIQEPISRLPPERGAYLIWHSRPYVATATSQALVFT